MRTGLRGADLDQMTRLSKRLEAAATKLTSVGRSASRGLTTIEVLWDGPDSRLFRRQWQTTHGPQLRAAASALSEAAATIVRNRDAQDATSADDNDLAPGKVDGDTRISGTNTPTDPLFVGIHPNDIGQGSIGNCYMLTSLAVIADQNKPLIRKAITDNKDGTYTVTFHEPGDDGEMTPVEITVTGEFPEYENQRDDGTWTAGDPTLNGDGELWPLVFEKAWGQYLAESEDMTDIYSRLDEGGQSWVVMEAISGIPSESTTNMSEYSMDELAELHDNNTAITLSSLNATDTGLSRFFKETEGFYDAGSGELHTGHAYWIDEVNNDTDPPTIVVRNPWGYEEGDRHKITLTYDEFQDAFDRIDTNALTAP